MERADEDEASPEWTAIPAALFTLIALLIGSDLVWDARGGSPASHLAAEALVMVLSLAGAGALWRRLQLARARAASLRGELARARAQAARYREEAQEALGGLGEAIDHQFARWNLTPSERDVGLLLLKGLSHREVARVRGTSEDTVRQQAQAVYRKAGLGGRAELQAFFLEDLLLPAMERS